MKFQEFKEKVLAGEKFENLIKIKHIGLATQKVVIDNIKLFSISSEANGMKRVDYILKELITLLSIIINATDIECENLYKEDETMDIEVALDIYDFLNEHDIDSFIYGNYDLYRFFEVLESEFEQEIKLSTTIEGVIATSLSKLIDKIPDDKDLAKMVKQLNKIDTKNEIVQTILSTMNGVKN
jgi:hypothetical protein